MASGKKWALDGGGCDGGEGHDGFRVNPLDVHEVLLCARTAPSDPRGCAALEAAIKGNKYVDGEQSYLDRAMANIDPDCIVPVDELRKLEKEGVFKKLHHFFYTTTGTGTSVNNAEKFGQEIGEILRKAEVDAAILTAT